jgi:glycosyltransferase involved in cell wall biosynthesis
MNVLMIGLDRTLATDKEGIVGDSQKRHILYGKQLSNLFIIVPFKNKIKEKKLSDNVFVYPINSGNLLSFALRAYRFSKNIFRKNKIDIITTQDPFFTGVVGYFLRKRYKVPLIVQLHSDFLNNKYWLMESKLNYLLNIIGKFVVKKADGIRVVSKSIKEHLINLGISPEKIFIIPIFTDTEKFIKSDLTVRKKYSAYKNIVLFVGRLMPVKNLSMLLNAVPLILTKHPQTLFLIVGEGSEKARLEMLVNELNIGSNVIFEGNVSYDRLADYYASCDIFVLPSNYEGWGRVVIEALASGKPVIMTDVGCANDIVINGENGFVIKRNDHFLLAQKIIYLIENPLLRKKMGENGRKLVTQKLDVKKNTYKFTEMYITVVNWYRI